MKIEGSLVKVAIEPLQKKFGKNRVTLHFFHFFVGAPATTLCQPGKSNVLVVYLVGVLQRLSRMAGFTKPIKHDVFRYILGTDAPTVVDRLPCY